MLHSEATHPGKDRDMGLLDMLRVRQTALPATTATLPVRRVAELPAKPRLMPAAVPVEQLPHEARAKADERLKFVQLVREVRELDRLPLPQAAAEVERRYWDTFHYLCRAGKGGKSALTYNNYRNWAPAVQAGGSMTDIRQRLADGYRRGVRPATGDQRFWTYLYSAWLSENRMPVTVAYDVAVKRLRMDNPEVIPPTINQARYRIAQIESDIKTACRFGETAYKNKYMDYITREWSHMPPGDLIVGDNRTFDTRVRIYDEDKQKWIGVRPIICALIDARSWYFTAWEISPQAICSWDIANTLAQYVGRYGAPPARGAYFDNGLDFCAQGFSKPLILPGGQEHSIFAELGMALTNSNEYNARAKTVERVFKDQMMQFDKLFSDYLGSKPEQRTMAATYFDQHPEELPSLDQFVQAFTRWLDDWHNKPKGGKIHNGESPADIWARRPQRQGLTEDQYRMAFAMPLGLRKVGRGPAVFVNHVLYYCDNIKVDDQVLVKRDHLDPALIHIYTPDGAFLGFGIPREPVNAMVETSDEQKRLGELIARQRRQLKDVKTAVNKLTGGLHVISAMELLEAPPDAKLLRMGKVGSVKGSSHQYVRYTLCNEKPRLPQGNAGKVTADDETPVDTQLLAMIHDTRHSVAEDNPAPAAQTQDAPAATKPATDFRSLYSATTDDDEI